MLILSNAQKSLLRWNKTHTLTSLWKIVRTDGTIFHFTEHNTKIIFNSSVYTPVGGFDGSARQKQAGLKSRNLDVMGVIDSAAITDDDLASGLYRDAEITEYMIDWRYPFLGAMATYRYWIIEVKFNDTIWEATIAGISRWLRPHIGKVFGRTCGHVLGDAVCGNTNDGVDLAALEVWGEILVPDSISPKKKFTTDLVQPNYYYQFGKMTMSTGSQGGANKGLSFEIQMSEYTDGVIYLVLSAPYAFTAGDIFSITPGCDKTTQNCKYKEDINGDRIFDNIKNYGGFPHIPGNDQMLKTPNSK